MTDTIGLTPGRRVAGASGAPVRSPVMGVYSSPPPPPDDDPDSFIDDTPIWVIGLYVVALVVLAVLGIVYRVTSVR
jgi:hypothetical protein